MARQPGLGRQGSRAAFSRRWVPDQLGDIDDGIRPVLTWIGGRSNLAYDGIVRVFVGEV
jgi:hypothetical protein